MKSFTDLEQSRKLAEFLPLESADMFWLVLGNTPRVHVLTEPLSNYSQWESYPCWSLAALIESITKVQQGGIFYNLTYDFILNKWTMNIEADNWREDVGLYDNPVDDCVNMILKLHEQKLL